MFAVIGSGGTYRPEEKPRRPCSAYSYYVQDNYRYFTRSTGYRDSINIFPLCFKDWKEEDQEAKAIYRKRATEDKERYRQQMMVYCQLIQQGLLDPAPRKPRKTEQPGHPRMTRNAFVFFCNAFRKKVMDDNPNFSYRTIMKLLGKMWRELPYDEKQPYMRMRDADKRLYRARLSRFNNEKKRVKKNKSIEKCRERLGRLTQIKVPAPVPVEEETRPPL